MNSFLQEIQKRPHPAIVHFPLTLFPLSLLLIIIFFIRNDIRFLTFGYWSYLLGSIAVLPVSVTGLLDFVRLKGHSKKAHQYLLAHLYNGILITVLALVSGFFFWKNSPIEHSQYLMLFVGLSALLSLLIMAQGAIGGVMVYQHKLGVDEETR